MKLSMVALIWVLVLSIPCLAEAYDLGSLLGAGSNGNRLDQHCEAVGQLESQLRALDEAMESLALQSTQAWEQFFQQLDHCYTLANENSRGQCIQNAHDTLNQRQVSISGQMQSIQNQIDRIKDEIARRRRTTARQCLSDILGLL